ncbi:MAG: GNAT family N-acetyltransferase [Burkholderiales bacterium]|nr:GNAT family N-acetyltransferase [Burkholderiales bacterium]
MANPDDRQALLSHPDAFDLPLAQIEEGSVLVAVTDCVVGFVVVLRRSEDTADLDGLFVEPSLWRRGVGRRLFNDGCSLAVARGARSLRVVANNHALDFYSALGFRNEGTVSTLFGKATQMSLQL